MSIEILVHGDHLPHTIKRLQDELTIHRAQNDEEAHHIIARNADQISGVAANGIDGFKTDFITRLPNLKIISNFGVGYDKIDADYCASQDIILTHTPEVLNNDVANTALLLMLAVSRRLIRDDAIVRAGKWTGFGQTPLTQSIENKKVGIVGLGRIGEVIAHKLSVFNCPVYYHNRSKKTDSAYRYYDDLQAMARDVDFLIVATPGGPKTDKLINGNVIKALGAKGTLINIARGSVVDEKAMVEALLDGSLGAAGLDVYENEPHVPKSLLALENVVLLPHVASGTVETRQAMADLTADNLIHFFSKGSAITPVPQCIDIGRISAG